MPSILPQPPHISISDAPGVSVRVDSVGRVVIELSARGRQVLVGSAAVLRSPLLASIAASAKPWETLALPVGEEPLCAWLEMVNDRQLDCRCVASEDQLVSALTVSQLSPLAHNTMCCHLGKSTADISWVIIGALLRCCPPAHSTRREQLETQLFLTNCRI